MKKIIIYILLALTISITAIGMVCYAETDKTSEINSEKYEVLISPKLLAEVKPTLIPKPDLLPGPSTTQQKKPESTAKNTLLNKVLPYLVVSMAGFGGAWALLFLIIGAVRYMTAYGNDEQVKKARDQIIYSIIGLIITILAYSIVTIVINIKLEGDRSKTPETQTEPERPTPTPSKTETPAPAPAPTPAPVPAYPGTINRGNSNIPK